MTTFEKFWIFLYVNVDENKSSKGPNGACVDCWCNGRSQKGFKYFKHYKRFLILWFIKNRSIFSKKKQVVNSYVWRVISFKIVIFLNQLVKCGKFAWSLSTHMGHQWPQNRNRFSQGLRLFFKFKRILYENFLLTIWHVSDVSNSLLVRNE